MYITEPVYGPPNRVTCIPGYPTLTTCKVGVLTLFDPAETPVVVTVNGVNYTSGVDFTLEARGTDHPHAPGNGGNDTGPAQVCWTGLLTVAGLSPWTRYAWTVVQGDHSDIGSLKSAPRKGDRHRIEGAGCDNNTNFSNQDNVNPWTVAGYWQHMKRHAERDDLTSAVLFVDDLGYVDSKAVFDNWYADDPQGWWWWENESGLSSTTAAQVSLLEYDYALAYCACLGMLGPDEFRPEDFDPGDGWLTSRLVIAWGREINRAWCRKNLNTLPQFGDHEFIDDLGWDIPVTDYPNGRFLSAGVDGPGWKMWHAFWGLLQPPPIDGAADTVANHWVCELGDMTIATFDAITNSNSPGNVSPQFNGGQTFTSLMGLNQIEDVLRAIYEYSNRWVVFGMQHSIRYLTDDVPNAERADGAQHPIYDHVLGEFQRIFTAIGENPPSLMDSGYANGVYGTVFFVHGDHHWGQVVKWEKPAYSGNREENFYSLQFGTTNGCVNFNGPPTGTKVAGAEVLYAQQASDPVLGARQFHGCQLEADGKTCYARLANWEDETMWSGTFYAGKGNQPRQTPPAVYLSVSGLFND